MFVRFFCMLLAMLLAMQVTGGAAQAQPIGQIASASGAGLVQTSAGRAALKPGLRLSVGDVVTTDTGGKAQLVFDDGTKIVVGPGSRLVIEEILMQSGGTAERFAVSAVGGTFRFISGKSAKKAYAITTPTATMGIRGTSFDFSVRQREGTNLVLFKGAVQMCGLNGQCAEIRGRCTLITLKGRGQFSGLTGEENLEAKDNVIVEDFPFVLDQDPLRREFRAPVGSCGDVESRVAARAAQKAGVAPAAPQSALPDRAGGSDNVERESPPEREAPEPERPDPPEAPDPDPDPPEAP
jgi:hypothetical protein